MLKVVVAGDHVMVMFPATWDHLRHLSPVWSEDSETSRRPWMRPRPRPRVHSIDAAIIKIMLVSLDIVIVGVWNIGENVEDWRREAGEGYEPWCLMLLCWAGVSTLRTYRLVCPSSDLCRRSSAAGSVSQPVKLHFSSNEDLTNFSFVAVVTCDAILPPTFSS